MLTKAIILCIVGVCFTNAVLLVGKEFDVDPHDESIHNLLQKAIASENAKGSFGEPQETVRIKSVHVLKAADKVTSGNIYTITYASKGVNSGKMIRCKMILHSRPWIGEQPSVHGIQCLPGP